MFDGSEFLIGFGPLQNPAPQIGYPYGSVHGVPQIDPCLPPALGSTKGEATAFYTYYRQRLAITNIRGVAKTILLRPPFCTGLHFPITPHHFNTVHMGPIPTPTQPTHPIDTPNDEHNDNNDGEEETTPTGDLDTAA